MARAKKIKSVELKPDMRILYKLVETPYGFGLEPVYGRFETRLIMTSVAENLTLHSSVRPVAGLCEHIYVLEAR